MITIIKKDCFAKSARNDTLRNSRTGQAVVELAVFGTLILFAFSVILNYGQSFDFRQKLKMEAFRKALQKAYYKNSAVSYTLKRSTQKVDSSVGFGFGSPLTASASATVMWQKGMSGKQAAEDEQEFSFYQINDDVLCSSDSGLPRYEKSIITSQGGPKQVTIPVSIWKETSKRSSVYNESTKKEESDEEPGTGITNTREAHLEEAFTTAFYTRFDSTKTDGTVKNQDGIKHSYTYKETDIPPISQGAYVTDENRISYSQDKVGNVEQKQRAWTTVN